MDVTQTLFNLDGTDITIGGEACPRCGRSTDAELLTLRKACVDALMATTQADASVSGTERLRRYVLARKMTDQDEVELTSDEVSLIVELLPRRWGTVVYGPAVEVLDPARLQGVWG